MRLRTTLGCFAAAAIIAAVGAGPASADGSLVDYLTTDSTLNLNVGPLVGSTTHVSGKGGNVDPNLDHSLNYTGTGQPLFGGNQSTINFSVECWATATPNPLGTAIDECYLLGQDGSRYDVPPHGFLPGAADAVARAVLSVPLQSYKVCYRAEAVFQDTYKLPNPNKPVPTICR